MINTHMSATSFQLAEAKIGDNNYLGNDIFYPPNGKTGANVPARHQDHDPDRWSGARERRPARLARFRDPAHGRPRPRHERVDRRGDAPRAPAPEESLQRRHRADVPAEPLDVGLRRAGPVDGGARRATTASACSRCSPRLSRSPAARSCSSCCSSARASRFKRLEPKLASIYDPYFWFHERHWKLSESPITGLFSGTPFRGADAPRAGHEGRRQGVRLQPLDHRADAHRGRRLRQPQRRLACCRRTRSRRACSSRITSASATDARSALAPSCTTASPWATMSCSMPIPS